MTAAERARKKRFRIALAVAGLTMEEWAAKESLTLGHVSHVLSGNRTSKPLVDRIEAFTRRHIKAA